MNKNCLLFVLFFSLGTVPAQAVAPSTPKLLGLSLFSVGTLGSIVYSENFRVNLPCRIAASALLSGLAYYVAQQYTPQNKFLSALKAKKNIKSDSLFRYRNHSNDKVRKAIIKNCDRYYPFLDAVKSLHYEYKRLKNAHKTLLTAPADLPSVDAKFELECKALAEELEKLKLEIKIYVKRIVRTQQWYKELEDSYEILLEPSQAILLDALEWATNLIGAPEASIKVSRRRIHDRYTIRISYSFSNTFYDSLEDW